MTLTVTINVACAHRYVTFTVEFTVHLLGHRDPQTVYYDKDIQAT